MRTELIVNPEYFENEHLNNINENVWKVSEMSMQNRQFLNGIIRQLKPKKILELGISAGSSSVIILNAIKDIDGAILYSIDYSHNYYKDKNKLCGFIVDEYHLELKNKWKMYSGAMACEFIEEIGGDIELVLLDTMHINPGEFLDYLVVAPFLKKNAVIVMHDTQLHIPYPWSTTNCILFSALKGTKVYASNEDIGCGLANIGAVVLDNDSINNVSDIFNLLTLPWAYYPTDFDCQSTIKLFAKYYSPDLVSLYTKIILFYKSKSIKENLVNSQQEQISNQQEQISNQQEQISNQQEQISNQQEQINKILCLLNKVAWFIPVRKWRDNFRNKFL